MKLFNFFFWKAIKIAGSAQKKQGRSGVTQVGLFFLDLSTIFTRAGSFVLVLNQNYEKQLRASKLVVSLDNYSRLFVLNLYMLVLY